ncbi:thioredoxin family protein [Lysobacter changpingensis]|uniref:thioredoxin family protein n=1 Tax=Lysobacter changpingensis TaxID=2792784 RepID=UPI001A90014A|nr:thioredoxin family protein [Lysobacter changpingensis]
MFKSILTAFALSLTLLAGCAPGAQAEPPKAAPAPEFTGISRWLNAPPQTMAGLKGKVVLVEFWTYSCINCIHVLPHVRQWHERYREQGLVVIGVHTPEYDEERSTDNVRRAIERFGIAYPVAQDNGYETWNAWGNRFWPALYLVDRDGRIVHRHYGEGGYEATEQRIRELLATR